MATTFYEDILLVLIVATGVSLLFERLRLPSIFGFLLAGVAMGPQGLGWMTNVEETRHLAELGVALLMLTIGLDFSFERLKGLRRIGLGGGGLQLAISLGVGIVFSMWSQWTLYQGFLLGSVIALSSTAMVLKFLIDRGEFDTLHGRMAVAILIFQDLAVIPLMIGLQSTGAVEGGLSVILLWAGAKALALAACVVVMGKFVIPSVFHQGALSRNREGLFLASISICLGMAWLSGKLGLSPAIGAFFAGMVFANSEYGTQLLEDIVPFRRVFVSVFFLSIGLLFDLQFCIHYFWPVLRIVSLILLVNIVVMTLVTRFLGYPFRIALTVGILLCQIGEFAFLLIETARSSGGIDMYMYKLLLSATFITLFISPLLFLILPYLIKVWSFGQEVYSKTQGAVKTEGDLKNHVIICGYGPVGEDLAMACHEEGIGCLIIDMNTKSILKAREQGFMAIYGDGANPQVMKRAGLNVAQALVCSFSDSISSERIIRLAERLETEAKLFVRARYERDVARWYSLGADYVIVGEWESSFELHRVLLAQCKVPDTRIAQHMQRVRSRKELNVEKALLNLSANP